jgi:ATP-binding cassette subfamily C (CFTR/MRP) protein 1
MLVGNNLFLGFWTSQSIHGFAQDDYMVVYAGLGIAQAVMTFAVSVAFRCDCLDMLSSPRS